MTISKRHANIIKAWLDGAQIQFNDDDGNWIDIKDPAFREWYTYRIKPNTTILFYRPYLYKENGIVGIKACWSQTEKFQPRIEEVAKNNGIFDSWIGPWVQVEVDET